MVTPGFSLAWMKQFLHIKADIMDMHTPQFVAA